MRDNDHRDHPRKKDGRDFSDRVLDVVRFWMGTGEFRDDLVGRSIPESSVIPSEAVIALPAPDLAYDGRRVDLWAGGTPGSGPLHSYVWRQAANGGLGGWVALTEVAVDYTDTADFPTGLNRAEGMVIHYWPSGTEGSGPQWTLTWRGAANGGAGAWMASGLPLTASTSASTTTTGVAGFGQVAIVGSPTLTVPANGLYRVLGRLPIQCRATGTNDARFGWRRGTGATDRTGEYAVTTAQFQGWTADIGSDIDVALAAGNQINMVMEAGTAVDWAHIGSVAKTIRLEPVELHP